MGAGDAVSLDEDQPAIWGVTQRRADPRVPPPATLNRPGRPGTEREHASWGNRGVGSGGDPVSQATSPGPQVEPGLLLTAGNDFTTTTPPTAFVLVMTVTAPADIAHV